MRETRKRIYLAGAISSNNILTFLSNVRIGIKIAAKLIKAGNAVFCPFVDYQFHFFEDLSIEDYYEYSLSFLEVCDEVYVLPGYENSKGTLKEIEFATAHNIPVSYLNSDYGFTVRG